MKNKKRLFIAFILTVIIFSSLQVVASAETSINPRVSYTYCWGNNAPFAEDYNDSVKCSNITTKMSLSGKNNATTTGTGIVDKTYYKEAYVGIKNSSGTWKTDTATDDSHAYVTANVNPIAFTPVLSQHEVIAHETGIGYKMHSRIYQ